MQSGKLPQVRLRHIIESIDGIIDATTGVSGREIAESFVLMRALERAIQIISEAAKELPAEMRALEPSVPWTDVIGIGNVLRHEYHRVREETLLAILTDELPVLRLAAVRLLAGIESQPR
ncbi:HepT-like ribonuclease domain-containing protein [Bosea sp. PAMC 26642]|uniref:HepT-like ribonuclease domain-containing protein n=1 Tax=Bosea sp. (strain PAMC 26642) TaxID=1792307 RepID=UPI00076FF2FB|nr:HepT-like ribonuclease domain-containing protein [Bosea sp. PAMC 26642]AMJ62122.1 hypothetical protein AXW83_19100 [Bosea sp. PAMC 26642]